MDDDQIMLDPNSSIGMFIRRCLLTFNQMSFEVIIFSILPPTVNVGGCNVISPTLRVFLVLFTLILDKPPSLTLFLRILLCVRGCGETFHESTYGKWVFP